MIPEWVARELGISLVEFQLPHTEDDYIDHVVVDRICQGWPTPHNRVEQLEVIRRLTASGISDGAIGARIGLTGKGVFIARSRNGIWKRKAAS